MSTEQSTTVALVERAKTAVKTTEFETRLVALAKVATEITTITNADGYKQCHAARMTLKNARVEIEKVAKAARDDAQKFSRAVIDEEKRLVGIVAGEEARLQKLQDDWDAAREAERKAKAEAERQRVEKIRAAIDAMRRRALRIIGLPAAEMRAAAEALAAVEITDEAFAEFRAEAEIAKAETLATMEQAAQKQEAAEQRRREKAEAERMLQVTSDPVRALREIRSILRGAYTEQEQVKRIADVVELALSRIDEVAPVVNVAAEEAA